MVSLNEMANLINNYNRKRKFFNFINYFNPTQSTKILDVGFTEVEFRDSDNYIEKNYPFPWNIYALGIEKAVKFKNRYPEIKVIIYDGNKFPFRDNEFDICWSNAVLEHVGSQDRQIEFLKEIKRVARSAWVTTPNKLFPIESHTKIFLLHFLPKYYFDRFLVWSNKEWATGNYMNLLSYNNIKQLMQKANIANYAIIKNKLLLCTMDFVILF